MTFSDFYGNEELKKQLAAALNHRFPQAVMLNGPSGSGKLTIAKILAAGLLCRNGSVPCDSCISCHKVEEGIHPDLTILDEGTADLKIETARFLRHDCHILPNDGQNKVYIIRHAQNLNVQAQNVLLKTLEEPPEFAFFILTCENKQALLPTVRSRVIAFSLAPLAECDVMRILQKKFPDLATSELQSFADRCGGIAGQALEEVNTSRSGTEYQTMIRSFFLALSKKKESDALLAVAPAGKLERKEFHIFLNLCKVAIKDAVFASSGLSDRITVFTKEAYALAQAVPCQALLDFYRFLYELDLKLDLNLGLSQAAACLTAGAYKICFTGTY